MGLHHAIDMLGNVKSVGRVCTLVMASLVWTACGNSSAEPPLPASVSPSWTRTAFAKSDAPKGLPSGGTAPICWKGDYALAAASNSPAGSAVIRACRYSAGTLAFDAVQRMSSAADTVQFQEGPWLLVVQWTGASKTDITTLVRSVQRSLKP